MLYFVGTFWEEGTAYTADALWGALSFAMPNAMLFASFCIVRYAQCFVLCHAFTHLLCAMLCWHTVCIYARAMPGMPIAESASAVPGTILAESASAVPTMLARVLQRVQALCQAHILLVSRGVARIVPAQQMLCHHARRTTCCMLCPLFCAVLCIPLCPLLGGPCPGACKNRATQNVLTYAERYAVACAQRYSGEHSRKHALAQRGQHAVCRV